MAKKLRSWHVLSCTLAILTAIAFIIACGSGDAIQIVDELKSNIDSSEDMLLGKVGLRDSLIFPGGNNYEPPSSSSEEELSSSSEEELSSSSEEELPPILSSSSSLSESSSSGESPYTIICTVRATTWTEFAEIPKASMPEVKCVEKANPNNVLANLDPRADIYWTNNPSWFAPPAGTYANISAKVLTEPEIRVECRGLSGICAGTITITAASSSSRAVIPSSSSAYVPPITPSSSSIASSSSAAGGGGCTSSNNNKYCYYGGPKTNCYKMPTDDCCDSGTLLTSCDEITSVEYCNYGECKNGDGWNCKGGGGCYPKQSDNCKSGDGGQIVSTCPAGTKPPSANY